MKSTIFAGIGALYVRRGPRVKLQALRNGGGQERRIRSLGLYTDYQHP